MRRIVTTVAVALAVLGLSATPALAHGSYSKGHLEIITGFAVEPAYVGQPNAVQLEIMHDSQPVTHLQPGDLAVDVGFSGQRTILRLEPQFEVGEWGTPGDYRAAFIPTQPGAYTFDVKGTVDGEKVDYSMTSGPKTFSEVEDTASAMFPPVDAPSTGDLATRIEQGSARTGAAIASANNAADSARIMAIIAGVVALVAVAVALVAIARSRRPASA
jgi:hypothetical protein